MAMYDDAHLNKEIVKEVANAPSSVRRYPSVFAFSVVFGGAIGLTTFSMLGLLGGRGFLVGFTLVYSDPGVRCSDQ